MDAWKNGWLTLLVPTLLSGCASFTGRTPDWVANPKSAYPENQYLAAVGEGDTRHAAENAAAANLSRVFEAHIESDERMIDQTHETGRSLERTTDFTADVNILSSQTLYNIQHAEAWKDRNGRYHAVAYLERRTTAALYRDKIGEQTARVHFLMATAEQSAEPLQKYANLRAALRQATETDYLLRQLKVIHPPSVPDATPGYSIDRLRKALADAAGGIKVGIAIEGDEGGRMAACIEELATGYGFAVGRPATLDIAGRVSIADTGQRMANLCFVRYALALQLMDGHGAILATINEKGREGHTSLAEANARAFRTLESAIEAGGARRLDAWFDSLVQQPPSN